MGEVGLGVSGGLPIRQFSTDRLAPRHRHAAWRNQHWPASISSLFEARADAGFGAETVAIGVGPLSITYGQYGAQHIRRSRERIRANGTDHLNVTLLEAGSVDGDWVRARPGDLAVADLSQHFEHAATASTMVNFVVPRAAALAHGLDPRLLHGTRVGARDAALLSAHLRAIRSNAAHLPRQGGALLARTVMDLLALALSHGAPTVPTADSAERTLRLRAEHLIVAGVERPDLGVDYLRSALGVSRSTLYRLFAEDGGVQARIRHERLRAAQALLARPREQIGRIAERLGFADPAHFSRVFRAEFGESPRDYRMRTSGA